MQWIKREIAIFVAALGLHLHNYNMQVCIAS